LKTKNGLELDHGLAQLALIGKRIAQGGMRLDKRGAAAVSP
jgi:hypothetical protein